MKTAPAVPRIALVSIGIGRFQRGFERYFQDLLGVLREELDVTLYKSGGSRNSHEKVPPLLWPTMRIARAVPLRQPPSSTEYKEYRNDCIAFGLSLLPDLLRNRFDILHCIDPPLAKVLTHLKRAFHFRTTLLFTEGSVIPPQYYPGVDHIHHVAQVYFETALAMGVPESHMTLVPCGLHTQRFTPQGERQELRKKYGISPSTFVVLAVTAVKRAHKRVDCIIEEVSRLEGDVLLWIDGNPEDPSIPELARDKLGPKCRITHVPSHEVPELYHVADVLVHASLQESFGLAVVEALCSGLMVLAHNSPHFDWLIQDRDCLVDMSAPGNLTDRLRQLAANREDGSRRSQARAASVRERFDWRLLTPAYAAMYRKVAALNGYKSNARK